MFSTINFLQKMQTYYLTTFCRSTYCTLLTLTGISDTPSPKLSTVWDVGLISNWSKDLITVGNKIACLSYIKSNKNDKCQKWHLTFELRFEMSWKKMKCQWHFNFFLKCHGKFLRCHKCHKCHKKKRLTKTIVKHNSI